MYVHETQIRVRYAETDQMSYVYNGAYAEYLEVGRVEALRALGIIYKQLELEGVMMPVLEMNIKYFRPARYDDVLTVKTIITEVPEKRVQFEYEISNEKNVLISKAKTTLVFVDMESGKPIVAPLFILEKLAPYFE
jgi:acyl-CoA thioester hydrolase